MIIEGNNINFNKRFGQNFIFDKNLLSAIAADSDITKEDDVVEIGAGAGTLTSALAERAKSVTAYEIDEELKPVLAKNLGSLTNVRVIFEDFMNKTEPLPSPFKVVANLPYYITTPIIMKFIEGEEKPESICIMVQKEVAERLVAEPNTAEYGAITACINLVANARITRIVKRQCFIPAPNVDSAVMLIEMQDKGYTAEEIDKARRVIKSAFSMRRKTLSNNLAGLCGSKAEAIDLIVKAGLNPSIRGETLGADDFVKLARLIKNN